jgi:hypothetical protein
MSYYYDNSKHNIVRARLNSASQSVVGVAEASSELYSEFLGEDANNDMWIRSFLITASRPNSRGWSVSPETVKSRVLSILHKPVTLFRNALSKKVDHAPWSSYKSADANYSEQAKYSVGTVERVLYSKENDSYYCDSKITNPQAKEYIKSFHDKRIPLPVSPQVVYNPKTELPNYYKDYDFTHLAIVEKGAYGPDAKVLHVCEGNGQACKKELSAVVAASASEAASASAKASIINHYESFASLLPKRPNGPSGKPLMKLA